MANLVSTAFSSEYAFYEKRHVAAFYELTGGIFHKNPAYPTLLEIRKMKQFTDSNLFTRFGIQRSLYDSIRNERLIQVLNHPENFDFSKFCQ
jgi:glucose-6-phosphate isomerase